LLDREAPRRIFIAPPPANAYADNPDVASQGKAL
jgi:hypothetical protein